MKADSVLAKLYRLERDIQILLHQVQWLNMEYEACLAAKAEQAKQARRAA